MKIFYVAQARIPTEKAHGMQIASTCAALARGGSSVMLMIPARKNSISRNVFDYYRVEENFRILRLPIFDLFRWGISRNFAFRIEAVWFGLAACVRVIAHKKAVIYGRDEATLAWLSYFSENVFWETHTGSMNFFARILMKRAKGIICITQGLADLYISKGVDPSRILVAPDAVDIGRFENIPESVDSLRKRLAIPQHSKVALYSGSLGLYAWKGVDVFLESSKYVKDPDARFVILGGNQKEIDGLRVKYADERILFFGKVPPDQVPGYLKSADVLVLPNKSGNIVSEKYTSPMKLFEYMASGRPIIASSLPSVCEVLDQSMAKLFEPNDPQALALALEESFADRASALSRAKAARATVENYTWDKRALRMLSFISSRL